MIASSEQDVYHVSYTAVYSYKYVTSSVVIQSRSTYHTMTATQDVRLFV